MSRKWITCDDCGQQTSSETKWCSECWVSHANEPYPGCSRCNNYQRQVDFAMEQSDEIQQLKDQQVHLKMELEEAVVALYHYQLLCEQNAKNSGVIKEPNSCNSGVSKEQMFKDIELSVCRELLRQWYSDRYIDGEVAKRIKASVLKTDEHESAP